MVDVPEEAGMERVPSGIRSYPSEREKEVSSGRSRLRLVVG
jgi:hypothetical protein